MPASKQTFPRSHVLRDLPAQRVILALREGYKELAQPPLTERINELMAQLDQASNVDSTSRNWSGKSAHNAAEVIE